MTELLSVGIDLGTTTTQMVVSRLIMENVASSFSVPRMEIREREIVYRSNVYFTPLLSSDTLDLAAIREILSKEYELAGICPDDVQTGAVIITGETARKENAREALQVLSDLAGEFVVATAGPALESVLAAKGAGADQYAKSNGIPVLHLDIGGGTTNLACFDADGALMETGCLNVGGRLMKFDPDGVVTYVSPVLVGMDVPELGDRVSPERLKPIVEELVHVLEMAAGLRPRDERLERLITDRTVAVPQKGTIFSYSGGVAELMASSERDWLKYGDIGVLLADAIRRSTLCASEYVMGREKLRATVIGAGSYSTELSGSTIGCHKVEFPVHNLPVVVLQEHVWRGKELAAVIDKQTDLYVQEPIALFLAGDETLSFAQISHLADELKIAADRLPDPLVVVLKQDCAKALGQALRCRMPDRAVLCLDGLQITDGSYLDVGAPVEAGSAVPVVVKTLAFS